MKKSQGGLATVAATFFLLWPMGRIFLPISFGLERDGASLDCCLPTALCFGDFGQVAHRVIGDATGADQANFNRHRGMNLFDFKVQYILYLPLSQVGLN